MTHGPAENAEETTGKVAHCEVCGVQWQVRSHADPPTDAQSCAFCGAPASAIHEEDEET
jgi:hypothetical protein